MDLKSCFFSFDRFQSALSHGRQASPISGIGGNDPSSLVLGIRVILLLQDYDRVFKGVGLRNDHAINSIFSPVKSPQTLHISPQSDDDSTGAIAACSAEAVCASARSGPARHSAATTRVAAAYGVAS